MTPTGHLAQAPQPVRSRGPTPASATIDRWGWLLAGVVLAAWCAAPVVGFRMSLEVLTLLSLMATVGGLFRPQFGLLGIGLLITLDAPARGFVFTGGILRWNTLNYWLLLVIALSLPSLLQVRSLSVRALQVLTLVLCIGLIITPDPIGGVQHITNLIVMLGILAYFMRAGLQPDTWYWLGMVCGLAGAAGSLMYYLQRAFLPYLNKNSWAAFPLTGMFAIALAFPFAARRPRGQLILGALATINLAWVFLSGSRGTLFTAVCCAIYLVFMLRRLETRVIFLIAAPLLVLAVSAQFTELQESTLHTLDKLVNPASSLANRTSGRSDLVLGGWYIFKAHPFGVGTGGFPYAWRELTPETGLPRNYLEVATEAHSGWIKTLAENGVPGIAALLALVCSFAVMGWKGEREARYLGLLVTFALGIALLSSEFQNKGAWFLAAGATIVLEGARISRTHRAPTRHPLPQQHRRR